MNFTTYDLNRDGKTTRLPALQEDFYSCNILKVTAGTNGICGGDSGHGGESFIKLHMESGDMSVAIGDEPFEEAEAVVISVGGDCELDTLIDGLKFAAEALAAIRHTKELLVRRIP